MAARSHRVKHLVSEVRRRWRLRAALQGGALVALTMVFIGVLFFGLYYLTEIPFSYLRWGLIPAGLGLLFVGFKFLYTPLSKNLDDHQIALYIEEKIPNLEDRLNSAIEISGQAPDPERNRLFDQLLDDASNQIRHLQLTTVVDRSRERILGFVAAGATLLFLVFGYNAAKDVMQTLSNAPIAFANLEETPYMAVQPGSVEIERGAAQEIITTLRDPSEEEVLLHYRPVGGEWIKEPMQKAIGQPAFLFEFASVQEPMEYFILHDEVQSDVFTISLYEFPQVQQIDLTYSFPDYTGLDDRYEENTGDIRGVIGSRVTLNIQASGLVTVAEMVLDSGERIAMTNRGDNRFSATITLTDDAFYHVSLLDAREKANKFPVEYQILAYEDEPPRITITDPQRDVRANPIEEITLAVKVEDDFGVQNAKLFFSVNSEDEEEEVLIQGAPELVSANGDYIFFLEDYILEAGDVISYFIEAQDYLEGRTPEASDMYFIEIIPFDLQYAQANNMGGMGGGGQQSRIVISQQEIIAATWKLHRDKDTSEPTSFEEAREGIVQAQMNLRNNIQERISQTAFSLELRSSDEGQLIVENLRQAVEAMNEAIRVLQDGDLREALKPERKALNFLLKADAQNRERQVSMNQNNQGGGGGGGAMEDRMTELMDLELDISRDKYEAQQQAQPQQQGGEEAVDETLQRIKDLARRQQRLANQRQQMLKGEDKKRYIERLKREQDELREQTESLQRNMQQMSRQSPQGSQEMQEGLQRAIDNMREAERALRDNDEQRAASSQQKALNELDRLQQQLQLSGAEGTREMLQELVDEFSDLREQEKQLGQDIKQTYEEAKASGQLSREDLERLRENRSNMRTALQRVRQQAEALEEASREEDSQLSSSLRNMMRGIDRDELEKKMEDSEQALERGWIDLADRLEDEIDTALEKVATQARGLEDRLPQTDEEEVRKALADLQSLRESIEDMQQLNQQAGPEGTGGREGQARANRMQQQLQQAGEALSRLQQQMEGDRGAQQAIREAQQSLRRAGDASNTGILLDQDAAKDFFNENVFDPLSELELTLNQKLNTIELEKKLFGSRRTEVPEEYREVVDRYYESLSKDQ